MATYVTRVFDTIDGICFAFYGSSTGYTEIVLNENPDLALQPEFLPAGLEITLPEPATVAPQRSAIQLWQ